MSIVCPSDRTPPIPTPTAGYHETEQRCMRDGSGQSRGTDRVPISRERFTDSLGKRGRSRRFPQTLCAELDTHACRAAEGGVASFGIQTLPPDDLPQSAMGASDRASSFGGSRKQPFAEAQGPLLDATG